MTLSYSSNTNKNRNCLSDYHLRLVVQRVQLKTERRKSDGMALAISILQHQAIQLVEQEELQP